MSSDLVAAAMMCCASCGVAEVDDIKLKECDACDLVRYCSDKCQQDHRPYHDASCKERATELREEVLFRQPESRNFGDCPICFLPHPIDQRKSALQSCCGKLICEGCLYANKKRELEERLKPMCLFCRHPEPKTPAEAITNIMKRIEANDPIALYFMGTHRYQEGDYEGACEYWKKAAELGDAESHFKLATCYLAGEGVEKDEKRELYHWEEAAIGGHPEARFHLGFFREFSNGGAEIAVKHLIIGANLGHDDSIKALKGCYITALKMGVAGYELISKEDFAAALRAHQAAVDATKSPHREAAAKFVPEKIKFS